MTDQNDDAGTLHEAGTSFRESSPTPLEILPLREYFETAIVPNLYPALDLIVKERPLNPVQTLAELLLRASPGYQRVQKMDDQMNEAAIN